VAVSAEDRTSTVWLEGQLGNLLTALGTLPLTLDHLALAKLRLVVHLSPVPIVFVDFIQPRKTRLK